MSIEIADRHEIQDLLVRYCYAVDDKDWSAFTELFTGDAVLDFTAFGGPRCGASELADFLRGIALHVHGWQHTISTMLLTADGAAVRARSAAQVMMIVRDGENNERVSFTGLWYRDLIVRTPSGWKIEQRVQERSWMHGGNN